MFQTKVVEKIKTHVLCSVTFFFENRALFEIMWKNIVERDRPQMTIRRTRIACRIPKVTNTHTEYVTLIAFPPQQWLHERASLLRYTNTACLVIMYIPIILKSYSNSFLHLLRGLPPFFFPLLCPTHGQCSCHHTEHRSGVFSTVEGVMVLHETFIPRLVFLKFTSTISFIK